MNDLLIDSTSFVLLLETASGLDARVHGSDSVELLLLLSLRVWRLNLAVKELAISGGGVSRGSMPWVSHAWVASMVPV